MPSAPQHYTLIKHEMGEMIQWHNVGGGGGRNTIWFINVTETPPPPPLLLPPCVFISSCLSSRHTPTLLTSQLDSEGSPASHTDNMLGIIYTLITALSCTTHSPHSSASLLLFLLLADTNFSPMCFLCLLTGVDAVIVLTQTPAVRTVSAGQEVVLSCNIQRYDGYYVSWYKQVPGGVPQYVLRFHHSGSALAFGSGFSSNRFNSKSSSNVDYQFIIKRAEAGDSARYFCQTWDDSADAAVSQWFTPWQKPQAETHQSC